MAGAKPAALQHHSNRNRAMLGMLLALRYIR
jgi:hypothetical protein